MKLIWGKLCTIFILLLCITSSECQSSSGNSAYYNRFGFPADKYPLIYAACERNYTKVKALLEGGVDANQAYNKYTALTAACFVEGNPKAEIVKILLEYGADVEAPEGGLSYLDCLMRPFVYSHTDNYRQAECVEIAKLLIEYGIDVNRDNPLVQACEAANAAKHEYSDEKYGQHVPEMIQILVDAGADVNAVKDTYENITPLMAACGLGADFGSVDIAVVKILIENGADIDAVDSYGHNALYYAEARYEEDKNRPESRRRITEEYEDNYQQIFDILGKSN